MYIKFPSWAAAGFGCPVPSALSCGHLSHGSIGSLFTWCCIQPQVSWLCRTGMVASVALGGLLPLGDRRELPMLTPHCHFAVFPQCRHFPEGAAGGREAEEEGGEAEGDPQGPAHLPLAVGAVAQGLVPHGGGDAAGTWSSSLPLGGLGPVPGSPLSVCAVGFVLLPFFFVWRGPVVVPVCCPNGAGWSQSGVSHLQSQSTDGKAARPFPGPVGC